MKKIKVAVNGFGRIGRVFTRFAFENSQIEIVAINDLMDTKTMRHLFKYDSVHRGFNGDVEANENHLIINGNTIACFSEKEPANLPWAKLGVDIVIESTGHFLTTETASKHIEAGAKKVIISAPAKSPEIKSVVLGVNDHILDGTEKIISNASCTTNCAAPMVKVLEDNFEIEYCYISTIHSYTGDQKLHDSPHKDLRRARAAANSIVPTTTGAAKAITRIFPDLEGKIGGAGIRVPVIDGSLTDITCILKKETSVEEINSLFKQATESGTLINVLEYITDPVVSSDIISNRHSCIFDPDLTSVLGKLVKVVGWYDNEAGYSQRLVDLVLKVG